MTSTATGARSSSSRCSGHRPAAPRGTAASCSSTSARACIRCGASSRRPRSACQGARAPTTPSARGWRAATSTVTAGRDLTIGTPGKNRVSVLYGRTRGLAGGRTQQFAASRLRLPSTAGGYGYVIQARDLDGDGFDDLVVGAPGEHPSSGSGAIHCCSAAPGGLGAARARTIRPPSGATAGFGTRLRVGDVDGDRHVDLVEGAPTLASGGGPRVVLPGHRARADALSRVRHAAAAPRASPSPTSTATVRRHRPGRLRHAQAATASDRAGEVRLWLGSRRGRARRRSGSPGHAGDPGRGRAGRRVRRGRRGRRRRLRRLRRHGRRGDARERGRGAHHGHPRRAGTATRPPATARSTRTAEGPRRGGARRRVRVDAHDPEPHGRPPARRRRRGQGKHTADERVMVVEGGPGVFAPDETRTSTLAGVASRVHAPRGGRIRLARMAGG